MIESKLIADILHLNIEGQKFEDLLFNQVDHLTIKEKEHTGSGLFIYFEYNKEIEKYRLSDTQLNELFGKHNPRIENFELINPELNILADATVHLADGLIDCVEIWNKSGNYPKVEIVTYELKRFK